MIGTISVRIEREKKRKMHMCFLVNWHCRIIVQWTLKINIDASNEHSSRMFRWRTFLFLQFIFRFRTFDSILSHDWPQSKIITEQVETFSPETDLLFIRLFFLRKIYLYMKVMRRGEHFETNLKIQKYSNEFRNSYLTFLIFMTSFIWGSTKEWEKNE